MELGDTVFAGGLRLVAVGHGGGGEEGHEAEGDLGGAHVALRS